MFRQYTEPSRWDFGSEREYEEALDAYDREMIWREEEYIERQRERQYEMI